MRARIGRLGAMTGLLFAIFSDLRRRVWWAYRSRDAHHRAPVPAIVMRRATERETHVPLVTPDWQPLVAAALPLEWAAVMIAPDGARLPAAWIDSATRPDVADLPRVIRHEYGHDGEPVVATQWLADLSADVVFLIVTFVEPVICTWAVRIDRQRGLPLLEQIARSGSLTIVLEQPPSLHESSDPLPTIWDTPPPQAIHLPITTIVPLRAILNQLTQPS